MIDYYAVGAVVAWFLNIGMMFAYHWHTYPSLHSPSWNKETIGIAIVLGGVFAAIWPIGLPAVWMITGFAHHGLKWTWR